MAVFGLATFGNPLGGQTTSCAAPTAGNPCVVTSQYDNARDAWNQNETTLTSSNVGSLNVASFSPLAVDNGDLPLGAPSNPIYAQPLYVAGIQTSLTNCTPSCNMLLAATLNGTVFAFNTTTGATVWSRQGAGTNTGPGGNALWYDDCGTVFSQGPGPGATALPFVGTISTPVIDYNLSPPTMFLTSMCKDPVATLHWYLHGISLTTGHDVSSSPVEIAGSVSGSINADDYNAGSVPFVPQRQHQRAGLLEAPVPARSGVNPLIYIAFGVGIKETTTGYHGWVFGYNTSLAQQIAFATTPGSSASGSPPCCTGCAPCSTAPGCCTVPPCTLGTACCNTSCVPQNSSGTYFQNSPNWCGHGGGIWMSGRAPAAQNSSSVSHAFFGSGNGGFQQSSSSQNSGDWGESLMDFTLQSGTGGIGLSPSKSFTPYGSGTSGPPVAMAPPLTGSVCPNEGSSSAPCVSTAEVLNENDWDFAVSGITLFTDSSSHNWLVTMDKAGYGYLLRQNQNWGYAFAPGDTYNWFPFGAAQSLCSGIAADCDRIASQAFFNPTGGTPYLYFYPWKERLAAYQFSDNSAQTLSGYTATAATSSGVTTVTGYGGTLFTQWLVPGDKIVISTSPSPTTLTVTGATDDAHVTVYEAATIGTATTLASYNGYFINPLYDSLPPTTKVGYPGGMLAVTSNGTSTSSEIVWAVVAAEGTSSNEANRTLGVLYAYAHTLNLKWTSNGIASFCASSLALPTVVNGMAFVPSYATTSSCPSSGSAAASGIVVFK